MSFANFTLGLLVVVAFGWMPWHGIALLMAHTNAADTNTSINLCVSRISYIRKFIYTDGKWQVVEIYR